MNPLIHYADKLKELGAEMNKQDNRVTAFPLFYIRNKKPTVIDKRVTDATHYHVESADGDDYVITAQEYVELEEKGELDDYESSYTPFIYEMKIVENVGPFFTEKAALEHIEANRYHYNKDEDGVDIYVYSAWRNYEMQTIMKFLSSLASSDGKPAMPYEGSN